MLLELIISSKRGLQEAIYQNYQELLLLALDQRSRRVKKTEFRCHCPMMIKDGAKETRFSSGHPSVCPRAPFYVWKVRVFCALVASLAVGVWILGWCGMMWVSWLNKFTRFKITFSHPRLNRGFEWKAIKSYPFLCAQFSAWFWLRKLVQKGIKPADIREARHHFLAGKSTNIIPKDRRTW